ncbi:MAG: hypothetical protein GY696_22450 [Gammaproteobacteria bacterium]|nr:hypothetical protein [Gammaproteobacteria bacterium]
MPSTISKEEKTTFVPWRPPVPDPWTYQQTATWEQRDPRLPTRLCYHHCSPHVVAERGYGRSSGKNCTV